MQSPANDPRTANTTTALTEIDLAPVATNDAAHLIAVEFPSADDQQRDLAASASHPSLPFGARAPRNTIEPSHAPDESTSAAAATTAQHADPAYVSAIVRAQQLGRTPPPPLPEYQVLGQAKAVGVKGRLVWAGLRVFGALEFVGEVFADFFGLYDSRYQYVQDAHDRHRQQLEEERRERAALRREHREELRRAEQVEAHQQPQGTELAPQPTGIVPNATV